MCAKLLEWKPASESNPLLYHKSKFTYHQWILPEHQRSDANTPEFIVGLSHIGNKFAPRLAQSYGHSSNGSPSFLWFIQRGMKVLEAVLTYDAWIKHPFAYLIAQDNKSYQLSDYGLSCCFHQVIEMLFMLDPLREVSNSDGYQMASMVSIIFFFWWLNTFTTSNSVVTKPCTNLLFQRMRAFRPTLLDSLKARI